jgi:hypothetical protein
VIDYRYVSMVALAWVALVLGPVTAADKSPLDRFTPEQLAKLLAGKVVFEYVEYEGDEVEEAGLGHGQTYVIVNKPIDVCWSIMTDYDKKQEYYPRIDVSEVVKREGDTVWVREVLDFGIADVEYVMVWKGDPKKYRVENYIDQGYKLNIKEATGFLYWEKIDDNSSLLVYAVTRLDVGIPVPRFIVKALSSRDLPGIAERVKKRVESDGKWKKYD